MAGTENNMSIANTDGNNIRPGKLEKKITMKKYWSFRISVVLHMKFFIYINF